MQVPMRELLCLRERLLLSGEVLSA